MSCYFCNNTEIDCYNHPTLLRVQSYYKNGQISRYYLFGETYSIFVRVNHSFGPATSVFKNHKQLYYTNNVLPITPDNFNDWVTRFDKLKAFI